MDWVERQAPEISACSRKCARERSECRLRVTRILSREALTQGLRCGRRAMLDHRCKTCQAVAAGVGLSPFFGRSMAWANSPSQCTRAAEHGLRCKACWCGACMPPGVVVLQGSLSAVEDLCPPHMIFFPPKGAVTFDGDSWRL